MVLVDTSIWVESFRRPSKPRPQLQPKLQPKLQIDKLVDFDEIVTCLPVVQEVLQGFRNEGAFRSAREAMFALPTVESPMTPSLFEEAVALYRAARHQGLTVRSSVDCLIAACALRHDLTVIHRDRDFTQLAKISPLRQKSI